MKNQDASFLHPVTQRDIRHKAVELFLSGISKIEISKQLSVCRQSVYKWLKAYEKDGEDGISLDKRGRPKGTQLKPWQCAQIVSLIKNYCPDDLSLPFFLWTRDSVVLLILKKFEKNLSKWTVGRYLEIWGLTPQKQARRAIEQDPEAIKKWFEIEYPSIQKLSKKEKATIHCGDEMGLRSDHNAGRTYALKGKTPVVKRSGNRFSCNMISTITNLGKLSFMIFHENFTSEVFLRFLKRLVHQSSRNVFLFDEIFQQQTSSATLNHQLQKTFKKKDALLGVLIRPDSALHNNPSETDARKVKTKFKISGGTRSDCGRAARDTFLSLQQTCLKLGINFIEFLHDRVRGLYKIPRLAEVIRQRAMEAYRDMIFRCASSALATLSDKWTSGLKYKAMVPYVLSFLTKYVHQRIVKVFTEKISDFYSDNPHIVALTA